VKEWEKVMSKPLDGYVKRLTGMVAGESSLDVYDDWASGYETTMLDEYGYVAPGIAVDVFETLEADRNARVLDLGCGTGLVGVELASRGYQHVDGLDISTNMLAEARAKSVYQDLLEGDMTGPLDLGGRIYAAAIGVGCFGNGHVGPPHLEAIIRAVEPGGVLVFYMNGIPFEEDDYPRYFNALEEQGLWQVETLAKSNYMKALDRPGWVIGARRGRGDGDV
jgi:SAM-dependent methyltransferase